MSLSGKERQIEVDPRYAVEILFHEYDALRAEMTARVAARTQFLGFVAAALVLAATLRDSARLALVLGGGLLIFGLLVWLWLGRLMLLLGAHLARVEERINGLVEAKPDEPGTDEPGTDEPGLLTWESLEMPRRFPKRLRRPGESR